MIKGNYISIVCVLFNFVAYYFVLLSLVHDQAASKSELKKKDAIIISLKSNNYCLKRDLDKIIMNLQHDVSVLQERSILQDEDHEYEVSAAVKAAKRNERGHFRKVLRRERDKAWVTKGQADYAFIQK